MAKSRETEDQTIQYPITISVRIDWPTNNALDKIAAYEHKKKATMLRDWAVEKVRVYERNPAYKRWLMQLEEAKKP